MDGSPYSSLLAGMREVFATGRTRPISWRLAQLNAMHRLLSDNEEALCEALKKDLNKCYFEAIILEFSLVYQDITRFIDNLQTWMKPEKVSRDLMTAFDDCYIRPEPYGTCLLISPWNYPIQLTMMPLIGAIAAGNCVIIKPSEVSSACSELFAKLFPQYMDTDCIQLVTGGVPETQNLLKQRFDLIMYTGSTEVGQIVMEAAAKHLTPVLLELGGKSPVYVDEDCDFHLVANRLMWGKCVNAGQMCVAPDYVMCSEKTKTQLVDSIRRCLKEFFGEDPKTSECFGRIITSRHFERVKKLTESSGRVEIGGDFDADEKYISPTVLTGVKLTDPIMGEEIFGPVLPIVTVDDVDEAIQIINDRDKPLIVYAFSKNQRVLDRLMTGTSSGSFLANDTTVSLGLCTLPFGGVGRSGMGSYHGKFSFDAFSHKRAVMMRIQNMEFTNRLRYPPFTERHIKILLGLIVPSRARRWCGRHVPGMCVSLVVLVTAAVTAAVTAGVCYIPSDV